ncbi:MAG: hypothetical protein HW386_2318 [Gammaproteobacteria bacterium]|nr:hypothetical protein [Gammaproteobacteria bacterium]
MTAPDQLPLRDIHLPEPVSWWPLPIGWWLVLVLLVVSIALCVWGYRRYRGHKSSAVYLAKVELRQLHELYLQQRDVGLLARDISMLLRRLSISIYPRTATASLTGEDWLRHLDQPLPDQPFTSGAGRILIEAPYRREVRIEDIEPLIRLCEKWIEAVAGQARSTAT